MACCDAGGRTKWGIFALLVSSAIACFMISTPAYFGILVDKAGPEDFKGCAHCVQDFGIEVLKSVNATDIADKLQKIHERNEKRHPHHHHHHHGHRDEGDFEFDDDECITSKDIDDLKPDLQSLVIPDWKEECKDVCTPVLKAVPLAATISGVLFFVGMLSAIGAVIPLCMLCCGCCEEKRPTILQHRQVPSATPVGEYAASQAAYAPGTSTAPSTGDGPMAPLLTKKF